ncbi:MAG: hypothetical protein V1870_03300 [Candidatus Aenigmatarchaeota archaeon]
MYTIDERFAYDNNTRVTEEDKNKAILRAYKDEGEELDRKKKPIIAAGTIVRKAKKEPDIKKYEDAAEDAGTYTLDRHDVELYEEQSSSGVNSYLQICCERDCLKNSAVFFTDYLEGFLERDLSEWEYSGEELNVIKQSDMREKYFTAISGIRDHFKTTFSKENIFEKVISALGLTEKGEYPDRFYEPLKTRLRSACNYVIDDEKKFDSIVLIIYSKIKEIPNADRGCLDKNYKAVLLYLQHVLYLTKGIDFALDYLEKSINVFPVGVEERDFWADRITYLIGQDSIVKEEYLKFMKNLVDNMFPWYSEEMFSKAARRI